MTRYTDDIAELTFEATTVRELLDALFVAHPEVKERMVDEAGNLRRHLALFVDGESLPPAEVMVRALQADSEVEVIAAMAGG